MAAIDVIWYLDLSTFALFPPATTVAKKRMRGGGGVMVVVNVSAKSYIELKE